MNQQRIIFTHLSVIAKLAVDGRQKSVTFNTADFFGYDFQRELLCFIGMISHS